VRTADIATRREDTQIGMFLSELVGCWPDFSCYPRAWVNHAILAHCLTVVSPVATSSVFVPTTRHRATSVMTRSILLGTPIPLLVSWQMPAKP